MRLFNYLLLVVLALADEWDLNLKALEVKEANRAVTLEGRYVTQSYTYQIKCVDSTPQKFFVVPFESYYFNNSVVYVSGLDKDKELKVQKDKSHSAYKIFFFQDLAQNQEVTIKVNLALYNRMQPKPQEVGISEKQQLIYQDSAIIYSAYKVYKQLTTVMVSKQSELVDYTKLPEKKTKPYTSMVEFGPFENVEPYTKNPNIFVLFKHNHDLAAFTQVTRELEISHWGNIAIEDWYYVENFGTKLKGEYSRVDLMYMREEALPNTNGVQELTAILPNSAWGLWYRDEVGNVSTSNARRELQQVILQIRPRFNLLGGWKANWNIGYNLPTSTFLFESQTTYQIRIPFAHIFPKVLAKNFSVTIVLPEGAEDIQQFLPYELDGIKRSSKISYLDTGKGRPTITLSKMFVSDYHQQTFTIQYTLCSCAKYKEIFLLIGLVAAFIISSIVYIYLFTSPETSEKIKVHDQPDSQVKKQVIVQNETEKADKKSAKKSKKKQVKE